MVILLMELGTIVRLENGYKKPNKKIFLLFFSKIILKTKLSVVDFIVSCFSFTCYVFCTLSYFPPSFAKFNKSHVECDLYEEP